MGKENCLQLCQRAPPSPCKLPGPRPVVPTLRRALLHTEQDPGPTKRQPAEITCLVAQSCLTLFDSMDCSQPGSSGRKKLSILISYVFTTKATSPGSTAVCLDFPHGTLTSQTLKTAARSKQRPFPQIYWEN